jgi:hypothetical protein
LNHEAFDDAVEFGVLVALGKAIVAFGLAGAELAEVFGSPGDGVGEEVEFDAS